MFTCPVCGSHGWGTSNATAATLAEMTGHCHGYLAEGRCRFEWSRTPENEAAYLGEYESAGETCAARGAGTPAPRALYLVRD